MKLTWSHALFQVNDMDTMVEFYTDLLGFEVTDRGNVEGDAKLVFLSQNANDHHQIAFASDGSKVGTPPRINHFAFRVDTLSEVKSFYTRLASDRRVNSPSPVTHGNAWSVYFSDPDGNGLEVFCDTPWHVRQPFLKSWDPAASDEEIKASTLALVKPDPDFEPIDAFYKRRAETLDSKK